MEASCYRFKMCADGDGNHRDDLCNAGLSGWQSGLQAREWSEVSSSPIGEALRGESHLNCSSSPRWRA